MDRGIVLAVMLLILALEGVSDASSVGNLRALMAEGKGDDQTRSQKVSPSPTPVPSPKADPLGSNQNPLPKTDPPPPPLDAEKSITTIHKIQPPPPIGPESKDPQGPKNGEHGEEDKDPKGGNNPTESKSPTDRTQKAVCDALPEKCQVADLVACLQHPGDESKELFIIVQNGAEDALSVYITVPSSVHIDVKTLQVAKHSAEKINISTNVPEGTKIVLNAGKGDCILHLRPSVPDWNLFEQFPAYASRLTPVYGAYFLFLTVVIAGGTWACCKFGRRVRRGDAGVPYQQLEMATQPQPQPSSAAVGATTADGWDQGWGDDWDDEEAGVRPSEKHPAGSVSSNGLTSRPPSKDGWDVDWDD